MLTKQEHTVLAMFVPNADLISDAARAEKLQYGTPVRWFQEHRGAAITVRQHTYHFEPVALNVTVVPVKS